MSNSSLASYTFTNHNKSNPRKNAVYNPSGAVTKITIHHQAGNLTMDQMKGEILKTSRQFSPNYAIDSDGKIGLFVPEDRRSWCTSSPANDYKAITFEVANNQIGGQWTISDKALQATIDLCVDICQRNGIKELDYTGDKNGNLTMHCWFAATACPGPYLKGKFLYIASEVNRRLAGGAYKTDDTGSGIKAPEGTLYTVQLGAFSIKRNCTNYVAKLKAQGIAAFESKQGIYWRAQCGAFSYKANAENYAASLRAKGLQAIVLLKNVK